MWPTPGGSAPAVGSDPPGHASSAGRWAPQVSGRQRRAAPTVVVLLAGHVVEPQAVPYQVDDLQGREGAGPPAAVHSHAHRLTHRTGAGPMHARCSCQARGRLPGAGGAHGRRGCRPALVWRWGMSVRQGTRCSSCEPSACTCALPLAACSSSVAVIGAACGRHRQQQAPRRCLVDAARADRAQTCCSLGRRRRQQRRQWQVQLNLCMPPMHMQSRSSSRSGCT